MFLVKAVADSRLGRQRSSGISEESFSEGDEGEDDESASRALFPSAIVTRSDSTRSGRPNADAHAQEVERPTSPTLQDVPQSAPPVRPRNSLTRRWGEAPSYLEAMSSPSLPPDVEAGGGGGVPPPRTPLSPTSPVARMGTGFRDFLSRTGLASGPGSFRNPNRQHLMTQRPVSQTSLLLQPQTSRLSSQTSGNSPYASPWASTHSLTISSPLPNSAMRASFEVPRAGLSDDQMRFLSSSEAVNVAGVKLGDVPAGRRRRPSEAAPVVGGTLSTGRGEAGQEGSPPSWDQVDGERRRDEAEARRGLAQPAGQHRAEEAGGNGVAFDEEEQEETLANPNPDVVGASLDASAPAILSIPGPEAPTLEIEPPTPISPSRSSLAAR